MKPEIHLAALRLYSAKTYAILDCISLSKTEDEMMQNQKTAGQAEDWELSEAVL